MNRQPVVAIYARKSSLKYENDPEAKSVTRQIDNAKKFATSKGWAVDAGHVYADDAISGAHFLKLTDRQRLLKDIAARKIDVLIVRDKSRFTRRESHDAIDELIDVATHGVSIWFYADGKPFTHGDVVSDVMNVFETHKNAAERRDAGSRVHEALTARAEAGYVASGKVFGYDNVRTKDGGKGHAEYQINVEQAAVVVTIFELAAKGWGYHKIAKHLTHVAKVSTIRPNASKSADGIGQDGWAGASVRRILRRSMYRGLLRWNTTKKDHSTGKPVSTTRPKDEWIEKLVPHLRIVDEAVWQSVQRQLSQRSTVFSGTKRTQPDIDSQYLLTGFVRCECGSGMHIRKRPLAGGIVSGYHCTRYFAKGKDHCANGYRWDMDGLNAAVVDAIQLQLTPARINRLLDHVRAAFDARRGIDPVDQLRADVAKLDGKIERLMDAIEDATSGTVGKLKERLKAADLDRQQLAADLDAASRTTGPTTSWTDVDRTVRKNLTVWQKQLLAKNDAARDWFRQAVTGPIVCRPAVVDGRPELRFDGRFELATLFGGSLVMDGRTTSSSSVDYTPAFSGTFRPAGRRRVAA